MGVGERGDGGGARAGEGARWGGGGGGGRGRGTRYSETRPIRNCTLVQSAAMTSIDRDFGICSSGSGIIIGRYILTQHTAKAEL